VSNIDFPSSKNLSPAQQRAEFVQLVEKHADAGLNAVIVQIRSACDAFYPSPYEPWSEYLTGKQGLAPSPLYDPLQFMVQECHKRGLEFHAWFNPYRAVVDVSTSNIDPAKHVSGLHPDWVLSFDKLRMLDPGLQEVRDYVTKIVMDVLRRYDVDGIHFDDYFYPYPKTGFTLADDATFQKFPRGFSNKADWRRDNVNLLIRTLHDSIKTIKPWVKFGVSPFGIWQNYSASQPFGSPSTGSQSYHDIHCDSRLWAQKGWVDYLAPQIYWQFGLAAADYGKLTPWWDQNIFDRNLYIGHAVYRVNSNTAAWQEPDQIPRQIRLNRSLPHVNGSIFYNTNTLNKNPLGVRDSIKKALYKYLALQPEMPWKDADPPEAPLGLRAEPFVNGVMVKWEKATPNPSELDRVKGYVLYRFVENEPINLEQAQAIRYITPNDTTAFWDHNAPLNSRLTYVLTAIDRMHNESGAAPPVTIKSMTATHEVMLERTQISCRPNPATTEIFVYYELPDPGRASIQIFDLNGRLLSEQDVQSLPGREQYAPFEVINWQKGMYIAVLRTEHGSKSFRFVVQ
jgi:uncharacterized lipoprotein YddW (UPF0748 family)